MILRCLDRAEDALNCFNKSLKLNPGSSEVWSNKGSILMKTNTDEGMNCLKRALELDPLNTHARLELKKIEDSDLNG